MNVPKIRLKGFDGEWELVPFSKVVTLRRGLTYSPSNMSENGVRVLRSCSINEDTFVTSDDDVFVKANCVNIPLVNDGDILITAANGSPRLVGKHCVVKNPTAEPMAHGGFMLLASSDDSNFLNASMGSSWFEDFKRIGIAGGNGAIGNLNKNELENFLFYVPTSKAERNQIAEYFKNLDAMIEAAGMKIASLKQTKQACLQQMFPQPGETTPRIRFKGFECEWQVKKIGEISERTKGKGYSKSDLREDGTPIVLYGRLYTKYSFVIDGVDTYAIPTQGAVFSTGNEVVIPASGETAEDIAIAAAIKQKGVILGGDLNILTFANEFDPSFMALCITNSGTHYELSRFAQGKSVVHLRNNDIANGHVVCPALAEQQQIAAFFLNMDKQIRIQEQRLEKLKQIKSACLNNMFV